MIVPSFSPPLQLTDDLIVPNLSTPPLSMPEKPTKIPEKVEKKPDVNKIVEHKEIREKRDKTEITKTKEEPSKTVSTNIQVPID